LLFDKKNFDLKKDDDFEKHHAFKNEKFFDE
jgi:hypothetical protein